MSAIERIHWFLSTQLGFDPRAALRSLLGLPRYVRGLSRFRAGYSGPLELLPCLQDWHAEAGATKKEYFWQDLLVARMIFAAKPHRHVDIGSSVEGFVAHVASFREIEVFDVRPINAQIPGVSFMQADLMQPLPGKAGYCDSLSCLHALEHFGLGRYGDPIDPKGFELGLANMAGLLKPDGIFYLSIPIGIGRVEFNGQRVLDPRAVVRLAAQHWLKLSELIVIHPGGRIETPGLDEPNLAALANQRYALGIFVFHKQAPR
jgi:SAM-dependent methyltransferase